MNSAELENWFAAFWNAYPRRVGKLAAKKAFLHALNFTSPQSVIEGAQRYSRERAGTDQQFTKHPSTWLNAGCWDDEEGANRNGRTVLAAADNLIEQLGGIKAARSYVPGSSGPESGVDSAAGKKRVRLISSR